MCASLTFFSLLSQLLCGLRRFFQGCDFPACVASRAFASPRTLNVGLLDGAVRGLAAPSPCCLCVCEPLVEALRTFLSVTVCDHPEPVHSVQLPKSILSRPCFNVSAWSAMASSSSLNCGPSTRHSLLHGSATHRCQPNNAPPRENTMSKGEQTTRKANVCI